MLKDYGHDDNVEILLWKQNTNATHRNDFFISSRAFGSKGVKIAGR